MKTIYHSLESGDEIEVRINGKTEVGTMLESYDEGVLLLKLKSGYNIGLKKEDVSEIKLLNKVKKEKPLEELKLSSKKPIIDFIITGGTISSKLDPKTGGVKDLTNPSEFFRAYPEIFEKADVRIKSPFMKWSENMESSDWIKIAKLVEKSLNDSNVKGVIISHGTDFLHYTSSALSFMLGKLNKPVVLTFAQKSSDRGSSDTRLNLLCSMQMALSDIAEVMVVGHASTNDDYCYALSGTKVRKMHTSSRDAFKPINCKPFAKVWPDGKIELIRTDFNKRNKSDGKIKTDSVFNDKIVLLKFYPGQDPAILDYYLKKGYKGIVVETSGLGHVLNSGKNDWIPKLKQVIEKGMLIFASAQTINGRLDPYVYEAGRRILDTGVIYLGDMLSETAFTKLGWVLGHKEWRGRIMTEQKMLENLSKEFNERIGKEFN